MMERFSAPVSVRLVFDHRQRQVRPEKIFWDGRVYPVIKIGLHHHYRQGRILFHVFSVASKSLFFRLVLNTETLFWTLEEISDGIPI